jgi:hypothetical protein
MMNAAHVEAVLGYALEIAAQAGEPLDLTPDEPQDTGLVRRVGAPPVKISKTKIKKLREEVQKRLARRRSAQQLVEPDPPPRYDAVFAAGAAWLDGPEPEPVSGHLSFSNRIGGRRAPSCFCSSSSSG